MQLDQILREEVFKQARVLSYHRSLKKDVSSVMILEAPDIERWGSKNQLILTSHFALINLSDDELLQFFKKLRSIQISGIIFKVSRLVEEVPVRLIQYSNTFDIPLIEIPNHVTYESILMAVFQPIINENSKLLNAYYEARKTVHQLSLKNLTFDELMTTLKTLLKQDVQFENEQQSLFYTTRTAGRPYKVVKSVEIPKTKFIDHTFHAQVIELPNGQREALTKVELLNVLEQPYFFTVFVPFEDLSETDIMLIENSTELLLTERLKIVALKKSLSMRKNNQMHDLLLARYYSLEERDTLLHTLKIDKYPNYQGVIVSLYGSDPFEGHPLRTPLDTIIDQVASKFTDFAYFQKNEDVIFLFNLPKNTEGLLADHFKDVIKMVEQTDDTWLCHIGISSVHEASLTKINDTLLDLKNFMKVVRQTSTIVEHDKLGFLNMFYKIDSLEALYRYVPQKLQKLMDEKPEYAITFARFLEHHHHYVKTAEALYVHPKTVRYRMAKVLERLDINLDDSEALLAMQVALKICEYTGLLKL